MTAKARSMLLQTECPRNVDEEEEDESLFRALADLELTSAAYPGIVIDSDNSRTFPLRFRLFLENPNSFVELKMVAGYPNRSGLDIVSYRSSWCKSRIESTVSMMRKVAIQCRDNGEEAGLLCCSAGVQAWNDFIETERGLRGISVEDEETVELQHLTHANDQSEPLWWLSGQTFTQHKSVFQAHLCRIETANDVQPALQNLINGSAKLQRATHNMWAYRLRERISHTSTDVESWILKHDNDDDGENAAGLRLAFLLSKREEDGVLIVVSRWYGGIHLGAKRFGVITNVARALLDQVKR